MTRAERFAANTRTSRLPQKTITLHRPVYGVQTLGVQALTFQDPVSVQALCQPANGDDLDLLPEGQRVNNIQAVWSTTPLYVANGKDRDSDVLDIDGVSFTVIKMFNRQDNGFYKVLAEGYIRG